MERGVSIITSHYPYNLDQEKLKKVLEAIHFMR